MGTTYDIGDVVRVLVTFTSSTSNTTGVDPSGVTFAYETPDGTSVSEVYGSDTDVVKSTTGVYYRDIVTTASGLYETRFTSTGTWATSVESWFNVRGRRVTT
jgi:hypothetical protein